MNISLETCFGVIQAVAIIIALASGNKDPGTKTLCFFILALATLLALAPFVDLVGAYINGRVGSILMIADGILCVLAVIRLPHRVLATLVLSTGLLMAAHAVGALGSWHF